MRREEETETLHDDVFVTHCEPVVISILRFYNQHCLFVSNLQEMPVKNEAKKLQLQAPSLAHDASRLKGLLQGVDPVVLSAAIVAERSVGSADSKDSVPEVSGMQTRRAKRGREEDESDLDSVLNMQRRSNRGGNRSAKAREAQLVESLVPGLRLPELPPVINEEEAAVFARHIASSGRVRSECPPVFPYFVKKAADLRALIGEAIDAQQNAVALSEE